MNVIGGILTTLKRIDEILKVNQNIQTYLNRIYSDCDVSLIITTGLIFLNLNIGHNSLRIKRFL